MDKSRQSLQKSEDTRKQLMNYSVMQQQNYMMPFQQQLSTSKVFNVATVMLDTAKTKRDQAMQSLQKIGKKRKVLTDKQHKLLEKAVSSTVNAAKKKGKAKVTQTAKRAKT